MVPEELLDTGQSEAFTQPQISYTETQKCLIFRKIRVVEFVFSHSKSIMFIIYSMN